MTTLEEILQLPNGAGFYRADPHVHSFGGSDDVKDGTMTPAAIVQTVMAEDLDLIAITDHNEIKNIDRALKAAADKELVVIPGVELSQGRLPCYLPDLPSLENFFRQLKIAIAESKSQLPEEVSLELVLTPHRKNLAVKRQSDRIMSRK